MKDSMEDNHAKDQFKNIKDLNWAWEYQFKDEVWI